MFYWCVGLDVPRQNLLLGVMVRLVSGKRGKDEAEPKLEEQSEVADDPEPLKKKKKPEPVEDVAATPAPVPPPVPAALITPLAAIPLPSSLSILPSKTLQATTGKKFLKEACYKLKVM